MIYPLTVIAVVVDEDDFMDEVLRAPVQHAETETGMRVTLKSGTNQFPVRTFETIIIINLKYRARLKGFGQVV